MKALVLSKPKTQKLLKDIRSNGYVVEKIANGYKVEEEGSILFQAMNGTSGYLIRYEEGFITKM